MATANATGKTETNNLELSRQQQSRNGDKQQLHIYNGKSHNRPVQYVKLPKCKS